MLRYAPDRRKRNRRSVRLSGYDYGEAGAYFVTICTQNREPFFNNSKVRSLAEQCWEASHSRHVELDQWVVMPDHVHGIIVHRERIGEA